jgi:hypothetical protein
MESMFFLVLDDLRNFDRGPHIYYLYQQSNHLGGKDFKSFSQSETRTVDGGHVFWQYQDKMQRMSQTSFLQVWL